MKSFVSRCHLSVFNGTRALMFCLGLASGLVMGQEARIEPFGSPFSQPEPAPNAQARVYAYRAAQSLSPAPINLYLNGRYHTSLLRGGRHFDRGFADGRGDVDDLLLAFDGVGLELVGLSHGVLRCWMGEWFTCAFR